MNIALILAGGEGKRAGTSVPKQFIEVNNIPVLVYTIQQFQKSNLIDYICVVSHCEWIDVVQEYINHYSLDKVKWIAEGGRSGLESVKNGLNMLSECNDDDIIMIHDSVRPFITQRAIEDNVRVAKLHDVALTSVPCVETLVKVDYEGKSTSQIPRDGLMRVMTPQSFKCGLLRDLYKDTDVLSSPYPSTFALYMSTGRPVYCSYGSERNIKITYPEDVDYLVRLFNY